MFFPWNILQPLLLGNITSLHIVDCRAKMFFCLCPSHQFWLFRAGFPLIKKGRVLPPLFPPAPHRQVLYWPLCFWCFSYMKTCHRLLPLLLKYDELSIDSRTREACSRKHCNCTWKTGRDSIRAIVTIWKDILLSQINASYKC